MFLNGDLQSPLPVLLYDFVSSHAEGFIHKIIHETGVCTETAAVRRIYSNWVKHWNSTDMKFSTSVWNTKVAAWVTESMLIHLIWTSTVAAS